MKFVAILKDSVREALDYKVIYFLFGLSALVILAVASVSYKPQSGETGLKEVFNRMPGSRQPTMETIGLPRIHYEAEDFNQLNASRPVWEGAFTYTLVVNDFVRAVPDDNGVVVKAEVKDKDKPDDKDKKDKKDEKDKKDDKDKPSGRTNPLYWWVFSESIKKAPGQRSDEDLEMLRRMEKVDREFKKRIDAKEKETGGPVPQPVLMRMARDTMEGGLPRIVSKEQLTEFLKKSLAGAGTMDVKEVAFKSDTDGVLRFDVQAQAREETVRTWPHTLELFFGAVNVPVPTGIAPWVMGVETWIVTGLGAGLTLLLSTIITAFFIPNMLRKGTVDLLVSKPVSRWYLFLCKYVGGLSFMFFSTVVIVFGIWVVLGVRTGLWAPGFLLGIVTLTAQFAILYAVSALTSVLWRSPIVSILATCAWWFLLWGVGTLFAVTDAIRELDMAPKWVHTTVDTVHFVLPRYKDFDLLAAQVIANDLLPKDSPQREDMNKQAKSINWGASVGVTAAFVAILLALACWRFAVKDY